MQRMGLSWTFAGRRKDLLITGDRLWRMTGALPRATEPRSFLRMPLVAARCFGGPGHPDNPRGRASPRHRPFAGPRDGDPAETSRSPISRSERLMRHLRARHAGRWRSMPRSDCASQAP